MLCFKGPRQWEETDCPLKTSQLGSVSKEAAPPRAPAAVLGAAASVPRVSDTNLREEAWGQQMPTAVNGWLTLGPRPPSFPGNGLYFGLRCPQEPHVLLWASEANMSRPRVRRLWLLFLVPSQAPISAQVIPVTQSPRDLPPEPCDSQPEPGHGCVQPGAGQRPTSSYSSPDRPSPWRHFTPS